MRPAAASTTGGSAGVSFRLADAEYQVWPQFTFGSMSSYGVSAGVLYHIF
jgi:hypothetical protein